MKSIFIGMINFLLLLCSPLSALPASTWVAEWDMQDGLTDVRQGKFKDVVLFAAYFTPDGKPFLSPALQNAVKGDALPSEQGLYLSVVNDIVRAPGQSVFKDSALIKRFMATEESRARHRQDLLDLLARGPFVGLEIDYEKVAMEDWPNLLAFAQELQQTLASQGKKMRFLLEPKERYLKSALPQGPEYIIMGYNLFGGHSGPGPKADKNFLYKLAQWTAQMPQKPGLALATGGFAWGGGKAIPVEEKTASAWARDATSIPQRDEQSGSLHFFAKGNSEQSPVRSRDLKGEDYEVWYADGETLVQWAKQAKSLGFGDIAIWRMGGNTKQSLARMAEALP